jgi:hypothetical protein
VTSSARLVRVLDNCRMSIRLLVSVYVGDTFMNIFGEGLTIQARSANTDATALLRTGFASS